jgi:hypothetical protein
MAKKITNNIPIITNQTSEIIHNSGVEIRNFRARQVAEVLRILKRPSPLDSEIYEGDPGL